MSDNYGYITSALKSHCDGCVSLVGCHGKALEVSGPDPQTMALVCSKGKKKANTKWRTFSKIPQLASVLSVIQNKEAREAVTANGREGGADINENVMSGTLYACWI